MNYYLLRRKSDKYIVYIGKTINPHRRLQHHKIKSFKEIADNLELVVFRTMEEKMDYWPLERCYIGYLRDFGFNLLNKYPIWNEPLHRTRKHWQTDFYTSHNDNLLRIIDEYFVNDSLIK
jgi:predicted GIY-YIG superfamily endonuclease